ncbi:hypothetical protein [Niabella beijingensis]|uniref:hypothetical protein n=1 Tax=Niabella beijingensis TaxID=2872700 RepID=UPI001CC1558B|nr:hypothetical protein [Niabella beijingensis]MBZ4189412.1 hypothetical protein [Niabella beijingensis]
MTSKCFKAVSALALILAVYAAQAQKTLKFENGGGPSGNGPTTTNKVVTFYNGDAGVYSPATTVTYSISNQQYPSIEGSATTPGLVFGGNTSTTNTPGGVAHYMLMNALGGSADAQYATNGSTPAIAIANDYGIEVAGYSDALINANGSNKVATNTKNIYFADLTLTFSRPVNNPVIHLTGLGGASGTQGFSMRCQLTSSGYTVSRLSGNFAFNVSGTTINNSSAAYTAGTNTSSPSAASGSVVVNGTGITALTFRVSMDGDGGGTAWSATNRAAADGFLMAVSLTAYSLSGTVFNDANGLKDNTVNGTGTNAGGLNAVLVDVNGNVFATVPVNSDGTYNFNNSVLPGEYSLRITTQSATVGSPAPAVVLPSGWVAEGEHLGSGTGQDGTPDGNLTGLTISGNVSGANFAIQRPPTSDDVTQNIATPSGNSIPAGTITAPVKGNDPEDGTLGNGKSVAITELPSNGTLYYNGAVVTAGQMIDNFDPALLSFTDLEAGSTSTSFKYSFVDAAGRQSQAPGTYKVQWEGALPVTFGPVSAAIIKGQLQVKWSTETEENNDHFEIQASSDGTNFKTIGTVKSKAVNGTSGSKLNYEFDHSIDKSLTYAGLSLLAAGLMLLLFHRKNKLLFMGCMFVGLGLFISSCKKTSSEVTGEEPKLFIRIVQIDKDGGRQTSKITLATRE